MGDFVRIDQVVENGLCTRCGTCAGCCPEGVIGCDGKGYPVVNEGCAECGRCIEVCPGIEVNYPYYAGDLFSKSATAAELEGNYLDVIVSHSTDENLRKGSSGGGIVTQLLLFLLRTKKIDGAIVVTADLKEPWKSRVILATPEDEIAQSAGSRYVIIPVNSVLKEVLAREGRFALVGLPCQIQGLRKAQRYIPELREKIFIVIGLYCHTNIELEASTFLLRKNKISLDSVKKFDYRGGEWPGGIVATLRDGTVKPLHKYDIKDGAINYLKRLFYIDRCYLCIDAASELADISVADAWIRDETGDWIFKGSTGWSIIITRTEKGAEAVKEAVRQGAISEKRMPLGLVFSAHSAMIDEKKTRAAVRIDKLKRKNKPFPEYHINLPRITIPKRMKEAMYALTLLFGKNPFLQRIGTAVAFSWFSSVLTGLKIKFKERWHMRSNHNTKDRSVPYIVLIATIIFLIFTLVSVSAYRREKREYFDYTKNFMVEKIVIPGDGKFDLMAYLYVPKSKAPYPGIVFVHGNLRKGKDIPLYAEWCRRLANRGYAILCFDIRGYGESKSVAKFKVPDDCDFVGDAEQAVGYFLKDKRIEDDTIIMGHSSGANIALAAGSKFDRVKYLVLASPGSLNPRKESLKSKKHFAHRFSINLKYELSVAEYERLITPLTMWDYLTLGSDKKMLIINAANESRHQIQFAEEFLNRLKIPNQHIIIKDSNHCYGFRLVDAEIMEDKKPFGELINEIDGWLKMVRDE